MLCVGDVLVGVSVILENAHAICRVTNLSDDDINRVNRWAGAVLCTLRTDLVLVKFVVCTLRTDEMVLAGVANNLAMVGCWWMACSVSSSSCRIASAPWELLMSLIAFVQSVIAFMTLSAWVMVGLVMFLWLKLIVSCLFVHLHCTSNWCEWHCVIIKWSTQVCVS